jgi:hypothetical protein
MTYTSISYVQEDSEMVNTPFPSHFRRGVGGEVNGNAN